jgi:hypothetical protein
MIGFGTDDQIPTGIVCGAIDCVRCGIFFCADGNYAKNPSIADVGLPFLAFGGFTGEIDAQACGP